MNLAQVGNIKKLNKDIEQFPQVFPITEDMETTYEAVSRLIMLDRYAVSDKEQKTLGKGDLVITTVKNDPNFPARGVGIVESVSKTKGTAKIKVEELYLGNLEGKEAETGIIERQLTEIDKPMELYYEQIAKRNAKGLSEVSVEEDKEVAASKFEKMLTNLDFVPAGRVLYGAGSNTDVTYFNCFVMPFPKDSRGGIAKHREEAMEIMSRGKL